ncbi:MAG: glycosyltransferase family 2 protein [Planctomycetaceae bacterium]|nr:glycosyltransferase family 2 protein [Planctomycetaceae bacterium]MCP4811279.1 glycosyltransferase family 2 protein [Planctomycetaceae bacterium]
MTTPLSIVLPVYNAEETLGEQVQDVFDIMENITSQFEILVVDDASTDATEQAAYDLICQFSQVRVVRHGRRLGTSEAIQTGLQLSEGQAVFVHKEHEPLQPHHLERFIEARQQPPVLHQPIMKDPPPMGAVA